MAVEKEDIVQYVQETPGNSNPAVLRSLLSQFEGSGEGATFKVEKEDDEKTYYSAYTGAEIDAAITKADTVPAVTVEDAGRALVVDEEGKIVAGQAGGGGGTEYIDVYVTGNETSIKYTIAEITAMVESGKAVILRQPTNGITILLKLEEITSNQVIFSSVMMDSEFVYFTNLVFQDLTKPAGEYKAHVVNNYFYEMEYTSNN